jgi:hypothetical protein
LRNLFGTLVLLVVLRSAEAAVLRVVPGPFGSGKAYVDCFFDGRKENCFLDTGSAMTLVRPGFSGDSALGTFHFKSASGRAVQAEIIHVGSIKLDGQNFHSARIGRLPKTINAWESSVGMDLLDHQAFALAFRDSPALYLEPKRPKETFPSLLMIKSGLLTIPVQFGRNASTALIDTGASVTAVDSAFVQAHPEVFRSTGRQVQGVDGAGHEMFVQLYRAKALTVGPRTFRNIHVIATDLSLLRENDHSALYTVLGFNVLRKTDWYFHPQNKVWSVR